MTRGARADGPMDDRERRAAQRREAERRAASAGRDLVPVGAVVDADPDPASPADRTAAADPAATFSAQLMGQTGQRRGLKGGPPVLNSARASYLGNEYSGENDRRPPSGLIRKTDA